MPYHTEAMVRAFIMVKTSAGKSAELEAAIEAVEGVREAHVVAGKYDIIVEAEGDEVYAVIHTVSTEIRDLDGVVDTRTYVCLE
jgi:DNA-binding Lrp family transcriptional regulator